MFFRRGGVLLPRGKDKVIEVDLVRDGDGLVQLLNGRDGRQLVLLLTLSVKPSLWAQVRRRVRVLKAKDARVLNANATRFKVPSHVNEREEQSEARAGAGSLSKGGSF